MKIPHRINISPELESEINSYLFSAADKGYDDLNLYEWASVMLWKKLYYRELVPRPVFQPIEMEKQKKASMRDLKFTLIAFFIMLFTIYVVFGLLLK